MLKTPSIIRRALAVFFEEISSMDRKMDMDSTLIMIIFTLAIGKMTDHMGKEYWSRSLENISKAIFRMELFLEKYIKN